MGAGSARTARQNPAHGIRLLFNYPQQRRSWATDATLTLLPLAVAGEAHTHQRRHLGLGELHPLTHLAGIKRSVNNSWK